MRTKKKTGFALKPPPPPEEKRRKTIVSQREQKERLALVEQLLLLARPYSQIEMAMRARYAIGEAVVKKLIDRVHERWLDEGGSRTLALEKEAQVRRLMFLMGKCQEGKDGAQLPPEKWDRKTMAQCEHEIAKIKGTYEPERLELDVVANRTALLLLETLSPAELDALVGDYDKRAVIDTAGSDVTDPTTPRLPH